jgi:hypothetical protein
MISRAGGAADKAIVTASALGAVAHKLRQLRASRETSASFGAFRFHSPGSCVESQVLQRLEADATFTNVEQKRESARCDT